MGGVMEWLKARWLWVALTASFLVILIVRAWRARTGRQLTVRPATPAEIAAAKEAIGKAGSFNLSAATSELEAQRGELAAQSAAAATEATDAISATLGGHDAIDKDTDGSGVDGVLYGRKG